MQDHPRMGIIGIAILDLQTLIDHMQDHHRILDLQTQQQARHEITILMADVTVMVMAIREAIDMTEKDTVRMTGIETGMTTTAEAAEKEVPEDDICFSTTVPFLAIYFMIS